MPRGPKGEKRHADVNRNAVLIAKIATGEVEDMNTDDGKNAAAVALGRMGGKARASSYQEAASGDRPRSGGNPLEALIRPSQRNDRSGCIVVLSF